MSYRPEGWDNTRLRKLGELQTEGLSHYPDCLFEAGADALLEALREEIEKVENPYNHGFSRSHPAFEECRQKILALL